MLRGGHSTAFQLEPPQGADWSVASPDAGIVTISRDAEFPAPAQALMWEWRQLTPVIVGPFGGGPNPETEFNIEEDAESGATQMVRVRYADEFGNPFSDWSEEQPVTVT